MAPRVARRIVVSRSRTGHSLTVRRTFGANVAATYAAWTDPELMRRWMGEHVEADVRPGGAYRREIDQGRSSICAHRRVSIARPEQRIVQTFRVETAAENPFHDEIVEVRFRSLDDGGTELALTDSWNGPPLTREEGREAAKAWQDWLGGMEAVLRAPAG